MLRALYNHWTGEKSGSMTYNGSFWRLVTANKEEKMTAIIITSYVPASPHLTAPPSPYSILIITYYNPLSFPHKIGRVEQIVYWILHYLLRYRQRCTSYDLFYVIPCTGTRLCLSLLTAVWTILSNVGSASQDTWRWKCILELQTKVCEEFTIYAIQTPKYSK